MKAECLGKVEELLERVFQHSIHSKLPKSGRLLKNHEELVYQVNQKLLIWCFKDSHGANRIPG